MLIELGNSNPKDAAGTAVLEGGPRVTYITIPDRPTPKVDEEGKVVEGEWNDDRPYSLDLDHGRSVSDIGLHIARTDAVTHLPGLEPLLVVCNRPGAWADLGNGEPSFVRVSGGHKEAEDRHLEQLISEFFGGIPVAPAPGEDLAWERNVQDLYHTLEGGPGVGFDPLGGVKALKTNAGNDIQATQMFNAALGFGQVGTATATSATSLTGGTESPGGSHSADDQKYHLLVALTGGAYAIITTNTTGTSPVYTVDRWYVPGSPGGSAASTPGSSVGYSVIAALPPAFFIALTANSSTPGSGDTTLTGEITSAGGGLIAKICPLAHSAGTNSQTLTPVYTANGSDSLPVTVAKIGVGMSIVSTVNKLFQTLLNATATLTTSGDQLTVTETVTM